MRIRGPWKGREIVLGFEFPTDARAADGERRPSDPASEQRLRYRRRRISLILAGGAIFIAGIVAAVIGEGGWRDVGRLRGEVDTATAFVASQQQRVDDLRREVERLEVETLARERVAREQLGLVRPGETVFLLPIEDGAVDGSQPTPDEARPRPPIGPR